MAVVVEHEKRKREILDKSLDVFVEEGYEDVTFQKIADKCGITRTTLYIYFKNKREIFLSSIRQLTHKMEIQINHITRSEKTTVEKLHAIMQSLLNNCIENRKLFIVLLNYLMQLQKAGKDPAEQVRRRIVRLRHLLSAVIIEGIDSGELLAVNVKDANELLYGLLESSIFRLAVLNQATAADIRTAFTFAIDSLRATV